MKPFLKCVAEDLYERLGGDLSNTVVVFPNKRAGLFFNEYLALKSDKPIWAPAYTTISELFQSLSDCQIGDSIQLVCRLYKVFIDATRSSETLDDFYFWGELLISDFDDLDKNLVDADKLFGNLQALKNMEGLDYLTAEQEEAIQQFFKNFSLSQTTELKQRFIALWNVLGRIYAQYKTQLLAAHIAYEGMLYRNVCEELDSRQLPYNHYVFVGFNALNKVERALFQHLKESGKALFYWDYDISYLNVDNHEAGEFIRRNLDDFPSPLPESCFDNYNAPKEIHYVEASTEDIQARYLTGWLRENKREKESETAIVLCNETLLQPVLHSLPPDAVKSLNITMGYPLSQTPVFGFMGDLIKLQTEGYNHETGRYDFKAASAVLNHSYTCRMSKSASALERSLIQKNRFYPLPSELQKDAFLTILFTPLTGNLELCAYLENVLKSVTELYRKQEMEEETFEPLYRESLFKAYTAVSRFHLLIEQGELNITTTTFTRLLTKVLSSATIPFHGEPAEGLQIMGVLETRNLDFKHLAVLSLNEGMLPKGSEESSFIPYNLRRAFGMTLAEQKNAVYAYYFYRLMQRAERVVLLYNGTSEGLNRGEMSRFMLQMLVESRHPIKKEFITAGQIPQTAEHITIEKRDDVMKRLIERFDPSDKRILSPSAMNCYLTCRLKFYFNYVAGLSPKEEVTAEIDSAAFGSIFHKAAELVYKDITATDNIIHKENIDKLLQNSERLQSYVNSAFKEVFFKVDEKEKPEYNGLQIINEEVITLYIRRLLKKDSYYAPFTMLGMEKWVEELFEVTIDGKPFPLWVGGIIDRIDCKEGRIRIIDFKTGGRDETLGEVKSLFEPSDKRSGYIFQTFLYAAIVSTKCTMPVAPSLLYIHKAASPTYSPVITIKEHGETKEVTDFSKYNEEFRTYLQALLQEIFNPDEPFTQTEFENYCSYCDFRSLCRR